VKRIAFTPSAREQYVTWDDDRKIVRRGQHPDRRHPAGLGRRHRQARLVSGQLSGFASRRITEEHRLIYRVRANDIEIVQCRWQYQQ
jgi:toxin YoeB